jgi:hypothetical protein
MVVAHEMPICQQVQVVKTRYKYHPEATFRERPLGEARAAEPSRDIFVILCCNVLPPTSVLFHLTLKLS